MEGCPSPPVGRVTIGLDVTVRQWMEKMNLQIALLVSLLSVPEIFVQGLIVFGHRQTTKTIVGAVLLAISLAARIAITKVLNNGSQIVLAL